MSYPVLLIGGQADGVSLVFDGVGNYIDIAIPPSDLYIASPEKPVGFSKQRYDVTPLSVGDHGSYIFIGIHNLTIREALTRIFAVYSNDRAARKRSGL